MSSNSRTRRQAPARKPPKAINDKSTIRVVAGQFQQLQTQREELRAVKVANQAADDDLVPGIQPNAEGHIPTYKQRFDELASGEQALMEEYEPIMDEIEAFLDGLLAAQT